MTVNIQPEVLNRSFRITTTRRSVFSAKLDDLIESRMIYTCFFLKKVIKHHR